MEVEDGVADMEDGRRVEGGWREGGGRVEGRWREGGGKVEGRWKEGRWDDA